MTTIPEQPDRGPADDFVSTDRLIRRQGARPIVSINELWADQDPFESDEEFDEFLADLYATRRADIA